MSQKEDIAQSTISSLISKWGDKKWFQVAAIIWLFLMPTLGIVSPVIANYTNKSNAKDVVVSTINERDVRKEADHKDMFEKSKHIYALAKKDLQESLQKIDCEYAFLIEYHNGSENIMTGIQFCKFDVTLEVCNEKYTNINLEKFRNENIAKYDILLSDDLTSNDLLFYKKDEFRKADAYLALQLDYINAKSYAVINLLNKNQKVFGTLLFVSINEHMNEKEIYNCTRRIEQLFNVK